MGFRGQLQVTFFGKYVGKESSSGDEEVHDSERTGSVGARAARDGSLNEIDWLFYTTYSSEQCKESISHMMYDMSLPDFLKLHEFTLIMSDLADEKLQKAKKKAEQERAKNGNR